MARNYEDYMTYDNQEVNNFTVATDAYEEVTRLTTVARDAGTYELKNSMIYSLDSTTNSSYFRFSLDGGTNWIEIHREPKDVTDKQTATFIKAFIHTGGIIDIVIQARKENTADIMIIDTISIIFERKI